MAQVNQIFNLYELTTPQKWLAGAAGDPPVPFYFNCADCNAQEPVIKGFLGTSVNFQDIAILVEKPSLLGKVALFCEKCFDKRVGGKDG